MALGAPDGDEGDLIDAGDYMIDHLDRRCTGLQHRLCDGSRWQGQEAVYTLMSRVYVWDVNWRAVFLVVKEE